MRGRIERTTLAGMSKSSYTPIDPQFRTIDGLTVADEYAALVTSWWSGGFTTAGLPQLPPD
jgi:hypothetical protein